MSKTLTPYHDKVARECLDPHLLTSVYKKLPQADRDGWFNGEMACNKHSVLPQSEATKRHLKNLTAAYTLVRRPFPSRKRMYREVLILIAQYESAVELKYNGGMHESEL